MDRVFIKPTSKEILIKDSAKEGYLDIYSYDYHADDQKRKLGNLYIIGNVSGSGDKKVDEEADTAYMVNLVASLAKREYYSKHDLPVKQAFSATLKKINEIVDEFFKNKETKVNIGIFAVAGEDILISKLGKFKILLSRDNQAIDILNNITLFNKEHIEEKEFSNIISGKVQPGDKLLAFYPSRFITSRERYIKSHFLKMSWGEFLEKINSIKEGKEAACAALYIDINKVKESALNPSPQPKELKLKKQAREEARLASTENEPQETKIEVAKPGLPPAPIQSPKPMPEIPKIIPSEFSSAKKETIFDKLLSSLKSWKKRRSIGRVGVVTSWRPNIKRRLAYLVPGLALVLLVGWAAKSFIFVSAEEKESRKLSKEIKQNISLAEDKIKTSDIGEARNLLLSSLLNYSLSSEQKKEMDALLDKADNTVMVDPVLVEALPEEINKKIEQLTLIDENIKSNKYGLTDEVLGFDTYESNLYMLSGDKIFKVVDATKGSETSVPWLKDNVPIITGAQAIVVDGNIFVLNKEGVIAKYYRGEKVYEQNTSIFSDKSSLLTAKDIPSLYIVNEMLGRIYVIDKETGSIIKTQRLGNTQPFTASWVDNTGVLYLGSSDGKIWKIE